MSWFSVSHQHGHWLSRTMAGDPRRVIAGVDGSPHSAVALAWAATDAELRGCELEVITVCGKSVPGLTEQACHDMQAQFLANLSVRVTSTVTSQVLHGQPARVLTQAAGTEDVLVVGTRGRSRLRSLLLGSVAQGCAERAPCPVVVIHAPGHVAARQLTHRPVVAGVDSSAEARAALRFAAEEAALRGVTLLPIHAVYPDYASTFAGPGASPSVDSELLPPLDSALAQLDRLIRGELAGTAVRMQPIAVCGDPEQMLLGWSESAALIVVGTRGEGRIHAALLGSVSTYLLRHARCPVAVVPYPPGQARDDSDPGSGR